MTDISQEDQKKLIYVLRYAGWALDYAADVDHDWEKFKISRLHQHAATRCIIAVGDLVNNVEYNLEHEIPHIPWQEIIDMRHRLAHNHIEINLNTIWGVMTDDFPLLIKTLEPVVGGEKRQQSAD